MKSLIALAALITITGCATGPRGAEYRPMVDVRTADASRYESDLSDCQAYANQVAGAGQRAIAGAIFGALIGAAIGHGSGFGNELAGLGALTGAAEGGAQGMGDQESIIKRCLSGRGYSVLN